MSDFTARISAILDTSRAQTQLNAFQSANNKIDIQVNLTGANANLNNILKGLQNQARNAGNNAGNAFASSFNSSIGNINTNNSQHTLRNLERTLANFKFDRSQINTITQQLNSMDVAVQKVTTRIRQNGRLELTVNGIDELGRVVTIVKQFDSQTGQMSTVSKTIAQSFNQVTDAATRMRTELATSIRGQMDTGSIEASVARVTARYEKLRTTGHASLTQIQTDISSLTSLQNAMGASTTDEELVANYERFNQTLQRVRNSLTTVAAESSAVATSLQINTLDNKMATWMSKNSRASKEFGASITHLRSQLANLGTNATVADLKRIESQFKSIDVAAKQMNLMGRTFGDTFRNAFTSITRYVGVSTVIYQSINALRQMFRSVVDIDTAMTELKKVTDETAESYNKFLSGAGTTAKEIGSTITAIVNSTADFSRLGYNFQDAQELAKVANIYSVVGDEVDNIDTASSSVISTMAAFKVEAEDAISIVDKFNEVGNNFAISSGGIGDALTRSASSMAAANNTLDETIALITAANTVVQDPDVVGTAFKTISMRIRGAKTELEEAGLETDGMAESTATLRKEIMALSGVDIMLDENTFKSTYQIMDELSQKWEELTDIQQASITELIAGKRQGNIVSSLMTNFDIARNALETSLGSEGSAMKEHEKWMESLEAKMNQLKAAWEELSMAFMNSNFLKGLVDTGTGILSTITKIIDTFGTLPTIIGAVSAGLTFKNVGELINQFHCLITLDNEYAHEALTTNGNMNEIMLILAA